MKITLCTVPKHTCPSVEITDKNVVIGEDDNICTLTHEQFGILKQKIKNEEI